MQDRNYVRLTGLLVWHMRYFCVVKYIIMKPSVYISIVDKYRLFKITPQIYCLFEKNQYFGIASFAPMFLGPINVSNISYS